MINGGTGQITDNPSDARLYLKDRASEMVAAEAEIPATLRGYHQSADVDTGSAHLRLEESTLERGEEVFVIGQAEHDTVYASLVAEGGYASRIRGRAVRADSVAVVFAPRAGHGEDRAVRVAAVSRL